MKKKNDKADSPISHVWKITLDNDEPKVVSAEKGYILYSKNCSGVIGCAIKRGDKHLFDPDEHTIFTAETLKEIVDFLTILDMEEATNEM